MQGASKAHDFANNLSRGPREYLVAVRSEGQFIGEMALFAVAAVRCASVRAKGPVRVKIVPGESLEELIDMAPEVRLAAAQWEHDLDITTSQPCLSFEVTCVSLERAVSC